MEQNGRGDMVYHEAEKWCEFAVYVWNDDVLEHYTVIGAVTERRISGLVLASAVAMGQRWIARELGERDTQ